LVWKQHSEQLRWGGEKQPEFLQGNTSHILEEGDRGVTKTKGQ
jgi:hypothetical protein